MFSVYTTAIVMVTTSLFSAPAPARNNIILRGHEGVINGLVFSPDGKLIATGDGTLIAPGTIRVWNPNTGSLNIKLTGHILGITCLAFSPDCKRLVSGGYDGKIICWDLRTEKRLYTIQLKDQWVRGVCISPDASLLAVASEDRLINLYDFNAGKFSFVLRGHSAGVEAVSFSPDGKILASGSLDASVKLWSVSDRKLITSLKHRGLVTTLSFVSDGSSLISNSTGDYKSLSEFKIFASQSLWESITQSGEIVIWNVNSQKKGKSLRVSNGYVNSFSISPDRKYLAIGLSSASLTDALPGRLRIWQIDSERFFSLTILGDRSIHRVTFSPKGTVLAVAERRGLVRLVNVSQALRLTKERGDTLRIR